MVTKDISYDTIPQELQTPALTIGRELDGLPLALDQAGAYIEATHCGLAAYFELYKSHGIELLKERGLFAPGHPDPVATTWVLSFQKIEQANPAAAELLRFCAFLHPDSIPEELITGGASELGPVLGPVAGNALSFNNAIGDILKFSLIHRDMPTKTLDIHRLVQSVILKSLDDEAQHQWIERQVRALNKVFPRIEFENWGQCDRLLSQAQHCASLIITHKLQFSEGARVLNQSGYYLQERARFKEAEPLYQHSLRIRKQTLGTTHPDVAMGLNNLGLLYLYQGKNAEAEPLLHRALAIRKQALGRTHPSVAESLGNLAALARRQDKGTNAKFLLLRSLVILKKAPEGCTHPRIAVCLTNLGDLYRHLGRYREAEVLYKRALSIREQILKPTHPDFAQSFHNLAYLYHRLGRYTEAEPLYQNALNIWEEALGSEDPRTQWVRKCHAELKIQMEDKRLKSE